jgi:membrane fusion protein, copper/silver efflux system
MKTNIKTVIIATVTLLVGLLLGWIIFSNSTNSLPEEVHDHTNETEVEIWTCSMHPQIRQNEPGDCPICGMELIPLENGADDIDPMAISMSPTAMQLASVTTAIVGKINPLKTIRLNGKVQADERLVYSQTSHIPGRIERLNINFTGEYVRKGQALATIYSPDLVTAQQELFEAQKIQTSQPRLFLAAKEKLKNWKITDYQIEAILKSGSADFTFPVMANTSGYVTKKTVNSGDHIQEGEMIYEISNLSKIWILFDVYESDLSWVKKGDDISYTIQSTPGLTYQGKIAYLDPVIDPNTRVVKARVEVRNPDLILKPEMFASGMVEANLHLKTKAVVIPKTAVMWTGKRSVVYVKNANDQKTSFLMRQVTLGAALGNSFIIEDGLKEGEEIVVNGTFSIDAAAQLAGKPSMMNPTGDPAMTGHDHTGQSKTTTASSEPVKTSSENVSLSKKAKNELKLVITDYLNFKNALTVDNFEEAQKAGTSMKTSISKVDMSNFTGDAHNLWMKNSADILKSLEHVAHFKNIDEIRKTFEKVSLSMITLTTALKPFDKTLYVQHCPMANENKGADWLSTEEDVKNPYFGTQMLSCGEVINTIK